MVRVKNDLTGMTFGRLTVLEQAEDYIQPSNGCHFAQWLCQCSCGSDPCIISGYNLTKKNGTQSCGCFARELSSIREKEYNKYDLTGEYGIGLTNNTNQEFYFDLDDYDKIKDYCWSEHISKDGYHALETRDNGKTVRMHYLIAGKYQDHVNLNPLDNRRSNLRNATREQNAQNHSKRKDNISGFSGVNWDKKREKWKVQISDNGKRVHIGYFSNKDDAIVARLQAELKYYGMDFSPQRHLFEKYGIKMEEK